MQYQSKAELRSEHVAKYLVTLCRHFARKVPACWDEVQGRVEFPSGVTTLSLDDEQQRLIFVCQSDSAEKVAVQQSIINEHIVMFARREPITLDWNEILVA
ncbi:DUF2218 domain-containing protein [Vibrio fluvialis]|jgi:hypothetical protein|uniref:DUF2218 domain-containing protein n=1 Tax=Vibrio fluvialis TaxID=676 RepID=UPI001C9CDAE1|nr:DUF2218 domain-containing protein [Vibrio fluvialis]ELE5027051.1 DUF2218 domain-containing protein [Vibrio fluvialis]ELO1780821.1 DUF2218 domain-containing protein [Vibrio fluvialis]MBY8083504.1 DUF2218 domain-containing protein [Vibrio fluvialis]MBY8212222.1 DUF2218 domain-containing protein [Vibrio fluvialis]MBY8220940.1 DUF2218 domain-containing protein [Vibrio fluvialis]